jgi:hypothetical protein
MKLIPPPKNLIPGSIVVAYLRDSGGDKQELSVPQQKASVEQYCKDHGLILAKVYEDTQK